MFITKKRWQVIKKFTKLVPYYYHRQHYPTAYWFKSHKPQVIIDLGPNTKYHKYIYNLIEALIDEKIGEVENGKRNSLKAYAKIENSKLLIWFWNYKFRKAVKIRFTNAKQDEVKQVVIAVEGKTASKYFNNALDIVGCLIGVMRGRYTATYNEDDEIVIQTKEQFMTKSLYDHLRVFHLQRNASTYCEDSISAIRSIERCFNINIHIHGQRYLDQNLLCENSNKWYLEDYIDDRKKYRETMNYYNWWYGIFDGLKQEHVLRSDLYTINSCPFKPHSDLSNYIKFKYWDEYDHYIWKSAYDTDDTDYNTFLRKMTEYYFANTYEICIGKLPWPEEFQYPLEPYQCKGDSDDYDEDEDEDDPSIDFWEKYEASEKAKNSYYDYEPDYEQYDEEYEAWINECMSSNYGVEIQQVRGISREELLLSEGI